MRILNDLKARRGGLLFFVILFCLQGLFLYGFFRESSVAIYFVIVMISATIVYYLVSFYIENQRYMELSEAILSDRSVKIPLTPKEKLLYESLRESESQGRERESQYTNKWREGREYLMIWTHQMKTPMAALSAQVQVDENPQSRLYLKEIFSMEMYLEMLLGYFRVESRDTDYRFESVDLNELVRSSLRKYAPLFIHHGVSVNFNGKLEHVTTDAKWFQFLLEQLLSNAVKYSEGGEVSISWEDGLVISDTGIGIRAEDIPRVYDMGYTGYNGRLQNKSTGIGLFLVKKIAYALNISIELSSKVDEGTRFRLSFPTREEIG